MASSATAAASVSFQQPTTITYNPMSPPTTASSPPDSRPTTTATTTPTLPASTPLPSLADLQAELAALTVTQHANTAAIASLRGNLATTTASYASLVAFLQASLSHRHATIARLTALHATQAAANGGTATALLAGYEASLAAAHRVTRRQQAADEAKYRALKAQLGGEDARRRAARKAQLLADMAELKRRITGDEARRQRETDALQGEVDVQRAHMAERQRQFAAAGRAEREEGHRRRVVREIEREKEAMMGVWEEARRVRREGRDEAERKRRTLDALQRERGRLRQERELREGEAAQRQRLLHGRAAATQHAVTVREEKEEELRAAVVHSADDAAEAAEAAEHEAVVARLRGDVAAERAAVDRLQAEERAWTTRGRHVLHRFHETQALFQHLLHALEAEKARQQAQPQPGAVEGEVVEWEAMGVDDRIRLVKLLLYRSRGERGGIDTTLITDTPPPPIQPALPAAEQVESTSLQPVPVRLHGRGYKQPAEVAAAAAQEFKEQILERRRSMTGGQVDGRKARGKSRAQRLRQLSSAPVQTVMDEWEEDNLMAVRGASMARDWTDPSLSALVSRSEDSSEAVG